MTTYLVVKYELRNSARMTKAMSETTTPRFQTLWYTSMRPGVSSPAHSNIFDRDSAQHPKWSSIGGIGDDVNMTLSRCG